MVPVMVERMIDGVIFRMSVRTPIMGYPIVRYQARRRIQGRDRWVTIPAANSTLLATIRDAFSLESST